MMATVSFRELRTKCFQSTAALARCQLSGDSSYQEISDDDIYIFKRNAAMQLILDAIRSP